MKTGEDNHLLSEKMELAIDSFVEGLKEEQKNGKLVESSKLIENPEALDEKKEKKELIGFKKISSLVRKIIKQICIGEEIKLLIDENESSVAVYGEEISEAIGKNGETLEAIEYVVNLVAKRKKLSDRKVSLDIKDYRKKNIESLKKVALKMAKKAVREGRKIALKPMCSEERKVIHSVLSGKSGVKTMSKDEGPNRRIIIYPSKR